MSLAISLVPPGPRPFPEGNRKECPKKMYKDKSIFF